MFSLKQIEMAFFNYDSDGSDSNTQWKERCKQWKLFKECLLSNTDDSEENS